MNDQPLLDLDLPEPVTRNGPHFWVVITGEPQPAGSKTAFVHPKTNKAIVTDANKKAKPWKEQVAHVAGQALAERPEIIAGGLWDGPVALELIFYRPRPAAHYGSGANSAAVKPSAPPYPITRPDALKLARGVEDALTGVLWRDDARIVDGVQRKRWGEPARCEIRAWRLTWRPCKAASTSRLTQSSDTASGCVLHSRATTRRSSAS